MVFNNLKSLVDAHHANTSHNRGYKESYNIFASSDGTTDQKLYVCAHPWDFQNKKFLRVEFNPSKIPPSQARPFLDHIVPGGYEAAVENAIVTRVDITTDIHYAHLDDLVAISAGVRRTSAYYGPTGTETYYLGDAKSPRRWALYDKVLETSRRNVGKVLKEDVPDHPETRIEYRDRSRFRWADLPELGNPFINLTLALMDTSPATSDFDRLFVDSVRLRGAQAALKRVTGHNRKKCRQQVKKLCCDWWSPVTLWKTWPAACAPLMSPGPSTFVL
jgi:hypothetical protein